MGRLTNEITNVSMLPYHTQKTDLIGALNRTTNKLPFVSLNNKSRYGFDDIEIYGNYWVFYNTIDTIECVVEDGEIIDIDDNALTMYIYNMQKNGKKFFLAFNEVDYNEDRIEVFEVI